VQSKEPPTVFGAGSPSLAKVTFVQCTLPSIVLPASSIVLESRVTDPLIALPSISTKPGESITDTELLIVFPAQAAGKPSPGSPMKPPLAMCL
jgi:hypothetical protein